MKKIIGILLASTVLSGTALANAGPTPCPSCPQQPPARWSGFKLGVQVGYGFSSNRYNMTENFAPAPGPLLVGLRQDQASHGVFGGFGGSYDYALNRSWVLGLDATFDGMGVSGGTRFVDAINNTNWIAKIKTKYTVAVLPRIGYVMNDSMVYIGTGWAGTKWTVNGRDNNNLLQNNRSKFRSAFRLAVGAAQRINRVVVGLEADYDWYSSFRTAVRGNGLDLRTEFAPRVFSTKLKVSYML
jgi:hypothetical protein